MNDSVSSSANLCPVIEGLIQAHKAIESLSYIALFIYLDAECSFQLTLSSHSALQIYRNVYCSY